MPAPIFRDYSLRKLRQLALRVEACLDRIPEEQLWHRPLPVLNSPGNLVLHLCGNLGQWVVWGVGGHAEEGKPDSRNRPAEFSATGGPGRTELAAQLRGVVQEACATISALPDAHLLDRIRIQGYSVTKLEAIYHAVEHFAGHTGQLIWIAKGVSGEPFDFYSHLDDGVSGITP